MKLTMNLQTSSYDIHIEKGSLHKLADLISLKRKVLILTDSGIPAVYREIVRSLCQDPHIICLEGGEDCKTLASYEMILSYMLDNNFTRSDCVLALGGGVIGDLAGFVAASYMRGIDFYNLPTTLLSQIDSSIGGKTGVNLNSVKNIVGAFYQPKGVVIDPACLASLPPAQWRSGIAEAIKMAICFDEDFFRLLVNEDGFSIPETVIHRSLVIKKKVVEEDEKEGGRRKLLNFGHTVGHAIEAKSGLSHGECVAIGMTYFVSDRVRPLLIEALDKYGLPSVSPLPLEDILATIAHDKKARGNRISLVYVDRPGSCTLIERSLEKLADDLTRGSFSAEADR